jgi:PIN domain nuclease of toxin-antitoxin system
MPARAGRIDEVQEKIRLLNLRIVPIDDEIAVEAARLRGRHRALRLPDALVIASAHVLEADSILTGDQSWRSISDRVDVIG